MFKKTYNIPSTIWIDVLNYLGLRTGEIMTSQEIHSVGKLHKAVHFYLFNNHGQLLLQKRYPNLDDYPNMYSASLTGHVHSGESSSLALKRKLQENFGMYAKELKYDFVFSYRRDIELDSGYIDKQFNDVYVGKADFKLQDINYNTSKVSELKLVSTQQFSTMLKTKNQVVPSVCNESLTDLLWFLSDHPSTFNIDVLNSLGLRTGEIMTRQEIHSVGKLHKAVHLYLFNSHNQLLLQKRAHDLDHYPNMYSISLTGHVDSGESSSMALKRELREELGLNAKEIKYDFMFSYRRDAELDSGYIDKQFNDVYVGKADFKLQDINYDPSEVSALRLVSIQEFRSMLEASDPVITPVYGDALIELLGMISK